MLEGAADALEGDGLSEEGHGRKKDKEDQGCILGIPTLPIRVLHAPPPSTIIPVRQAFQHHYSFLLLRDSIVIDHLL